MTQQTTTDKAISILRTRANEPGFARDMCLQYAEQLELQELIGEPEFDQVANYLAALVIKANDEYTARLCGMKSDQISDYADARLCARFQNPL
jgi:hypothetical protein